MYTLLRGASVCVRILHEGGLSEQGKVGLKTGPGEGGIESKRELPPYKPNIPKFPPEEKPQLPPDFGGVGLDTKKSGVGLKIAQNKVASAKNSIDGAKWAIEQSKQDLQKLRYDRLLVKFVSFGQDTENAEKLAQEYMSLNKERGDLLRLDVTKSKEDRKVMYRKWFDEFLSTKGMEKPIVTPKDSQEVGPIDPTDPKNIAIAEEARKSEEFYQREEEEIAQLRAAQFEQDMAEKSYIQASSDYQQAVLVNESEPTVHEQNNNTIESIQGAQGGSDPDTVGMHPINDIIKDSGVNIDVYISPDGAYTMIDPDTGKVWNADNKKQFIEMYGYYSNLKTPLNQIQNMGEDRGMLVIRELGRIWSKKMNSQMTPENMRSMVILAISRELSGGQGGPMDVTLSDIASGGVNYKKIIETPLNVGSNMGIFDSAAKNIGFFSQEGVPNIGKIFEAVGKISG